MQREEEKQYFRATMLGAEKRWGKEMDQWWMGEGHWEENKGILEFQNFQAQKGARDVNKTLDLSLPIFRNYKIFQRFSEKRMF